MLYVAQDISARVLSHNFPSAEGFFVEIKLHKKKWLINCSYNPNMKNYLEAISKTLDASSTKYKNILLLDNFNACADDETKKCLQSLLFKTFIKQPKCFKDNENPSCTDLRLINKSRCFQSTCVKETELPHFYRMTVFALKMHFSKLPSKSIN